MAWSFASLGLIGASLLKQTQRVGSGIPRRALVAGSTRPSRVIRHGSAQLREANPQGRTPGRQGALTSSVHWIVDRGSAGALSVRARDSLQRRLLVD